MKWNRERGGYQVVTAALGSGQKCQWKVMREMGKLMKSGSSESRSR